MTDRVPQVNRWLVLQMGARMHYAVPAALARRGMLAELWTDMHADDWPARFARWALPGSVRPGLVNGMLGRHLPLEIPPQLVSSFPVRTLWCRGRGKYVDLSINRQLLRRGFGSADGLYSVMFGDVDVIAEAKRRGRYVAFEQVTNPERADISHSEREAFPGVEAQEDRRNDGTFLEAHRRIWNLADVVLAPSRFVMDGIARLGGGLQKTKLVPYAVSSNWFKGKAHPQVGRVLFVGAVCLGKGSHYLAMAARILRQRNVRCEIRVVGPHSDAIERSSLFHGPTYVGAIPRDRVMSEYLAADVFVLPTLYEGSATAHIEALACGLPVITTSHCGTFVRDGVEGFVVPIRDAAALADRIEAIVTNRQLRAEMGSQAKQLALREHTWERYEERLVEVLSARR